MASFEDRLAGARKLARHPDILVTDIEARLGTRYTADTLARLRRRYPAHRFVWLMGADNMIQVTRWKRWPEIFEAVPVAIFDRPGYHYRALAGCAARRFWRYRVGRQGFKRLADRTPPAWIFVACPPHPASATAIRAGRRPD
jgi:nicotinate-nucleotide adenylyltransferase